MDQLTVVIRSVDKAGTPRERFIKFISKCGHKSEELAQAILSLFEELDLNIANCRGQSYDNASNMSGAYSGLQARIKAVNPLAEFVPCAAHSLNLVGTCAAESCAAAVHFFSILQGVYNFFSASTHRWDLLTSKTMGEHTVKSLSQTRWSARHDACRSLCESRSEIISVLHDISEDSNEKPQTRSEALGIYKSLQSLETCFISLFWNDILKRFNVVNKSLQSASLELKSVVELYKSLELFIVKMRTPSAFDYYEKLAIEKSGIEQYRADGSRKKKRKTRFDKQNTATETSFSARDDMRVNTFFYILDTLVVNLQKRSKCYDYLYNKFGFLMQLNVLSDEEISRNAKDLIDSYPNDLEEELITECQHFGVHLQVMKIIKPSALSLCRLICENNFVDIYPNVNIALTILLCMMSTNCSGERTFSILRRVKNYLRASQTNKRLNALSLHCIESEVFRKLNFDSVIDEFAIEKTRRVIL